MAINLLASPPARAFPCWVLSSREWRPGAGRGLPAGTPRQGTEAC